MQFGKRAADAPDAGASGNYLRNWKKGENLCRILQEIDDWTQYWEHYKGKKSFPCTEDRDTCPGCTHEDEEVQKASKKYATYAKLIKQDKVFAMRIPATLHDRFVVRAERNNGTVTNRDYVVIKTGTGFDTEYDVDQEDKYDVNVEVELKRAPCTVQEALQDSYVEVWGKLPDGSAPATPAPAVADPEDKPPSKPANQSASAEQQEEVLTESAIKAMELPQLQELCKRAGLRFVEDDTKDDLVEKLLRTFGD